MIWGRKLEICAPGLNTDLMNCSILLNQMYNNSSILFIKNIRLSMSKSDFKQDYIEKIL